MISLPIFAFITSSILLAGSAMILLAIGLGMKTGFSQAFKDTDNYTDKKSK